MIIDAKTKKERLLCRNALSLKNALANITEDNFTEIEIVIVDSYVLNDPMES
jgi:hypothetical protein